jgi:hypothetical protein
LLFIMDLLATDMSPAGAGVDARAQARLHGLQRATYANFWKGDVLAAWTSGHQADLGSVSPV